MKIYIYIQTKTPPSLNFIFFFLIFINTVVFSQNEERIEDFTDLDFSGLINKEIYTGSKHKTKISEIPASVILIERKEIEDLGYHSLEEILQNISGFYMIDDYYWLGSVNFGVRGFYSSGEFSHVTILINGVNQVGDSRDFYPMSKINIPVESIDRIEIIRGPMSVLYGRGAFFGAINIITNEIDLKKPKNQLSALIENDQSYRTFLRLSDQLQGFQYSLNASYAQINSVDVSFSEMTNDAVFLQQMGVSANSRTKGILDDLQKHINFSGTFKNLQLDISIIEGTKEVFDGLPSIGSGSKLASYSNNFSLAYKKDFSEQFQLNTKFGFFKHQYCIDYQIIHTDAYAYNHLSSNSYEAEINALFVPKHNIEILTGLHRRSIVRLMQVYDYPVFGDLYSNTKFTLPTDVNQNALFSQLSWQVLEKLKFVGGIRLEYNEAYEMVYQKSMGTSVENTQSGEYINNKIEFIPQAAFIYHLNKYNIFKLLYGEATKQPSIMQNAVLLGTSQVQLETSKIQTFELNYMHTQNDLFLINLSLFHNKLNNLISKHNEYLLNEQMWILRSANEGKLETSGAEMNFQINIITNKIKLNTGIVYQKTKNMEVGFEDIKPGYSPDLLVQSSINYQFNNFITININSIFTDAMETKWDNSPINPTASDFSPKGRIGNSISAFSVTNINLQFHHLFHKNIFINLKISNIFDQKISYPTTINNIWLEKGSIGKGRIFNVHAGIKF